ncbi:MAG: RNA methyltransferase [Candidatus Bathyarchaeia archaeon]
MEVRVVLVEPEHEGNIGLIARSMKNLGFDDLWLVNPKVKLGPEARALASRAQDILSGVKVTGNLEDALEGCDYVAATTAIVGRSPSNLSRTPITLREFTQKILGPNIRVAILFGRESRGLTNNEISRCDLVIHIPTDPTYKTLNMAIAASIILYEIRIARLKLRRSECASREVRWRLLEIFEELSREVGLPPHRIPLAKKALRNVISRGLVSRREASLLIGTLRRAADKLKTIRR